MGRSRLSRAGSGWLPAHAFLTGPAPPSHHLPAAQGSLGTSGFLRGCFPHFWKPTVVCFSVVKALAGAQPSGRAGDWEGPEPKAYSLSTHCVPGLGDSQKLKTVPVLGKLHHLVMDTDKKHEELKTDLKLVSNRSPRHSNRSPRHSSREPAHPRLAPPPRPSPRGSAVWPRPSDSQAPAPFTPPPGESPSLGGRPSSLARWHLLSP